MQVLAGSKQKELGVSSMGLMAEYTPVAFVMLCVLVAVMEPMGNTSNPNTLLGFKYTPLASHSCPSFQLRMKCSQGECGQNCSLSVCKDAGNLHYLCSSIFVMHQMKRCTRNQCTEWRRTEAGCAV